MYRQHQQQYRHRHRHRHRRCHKLWKQPRFWFLLIIVISIFHLLVSFLTIERHKSLSMSTSSFFDYVGPLSSSSTTTSRRFSTESRIWYQMLFMIQEEKKKEEEKENKNSYNVRKKRKSSKNRFPCGKYYGSNSSTNNNNNNIKNFVDRGEDYVELVPFGFPNSIRAYVQQEENKSSIGSSTMSSSSSSYCIAPPSVPSCQSSQYTVVIYSSSADAPAEITNNSTGIMNNEYDDSNSNNHDYWRQIVIRVMSFLAYPSVQRVNLILRESMSVDVDVDVDDLVIGDKNTNINKNNTAPASRNRSTNTTRRRKGTIPFFLQNAAKRNKYAKRIQYWNEKGTVHVLTTASLWNGLNRLDVPSESILWIDGDQNNGVIINGTKLKGRLRLWREIPSTLVIRDDGMNNDDIDGDILLLSKQQQPADTAVAPSSNCASLPSSFPLLSLHGMMMHKNYLCYLNHPIIGSNLRNYIDSLYINDNDSNKNNDSIDKSMVNFPSITWDITTIAIGMLLFQISDGYVIDDYDQNAITKKKTKINNSNHQSSSIKNLLMNVVDSDNNKHENDINRNIHQRNSITLHIDKIAKYFGYDEGMRTTTTSKRRLSLPSQRQCIIGDA
mmetsp:Transcript_28201/g.31680  ORF Transcript_28201/g.31680 Transcript_28201/m.31680 type:complete len:611 (-) Transcript_28201:42-1874(-)